jgi:hypothetical protein
VDGACDDLLAGAGAGLAEQEHGRVAVGQQADRLLHLPHGGAGAHQAAVLRIGRAAARWRLRSVRRQHPLQQAHEVVSPDRLGQMIGGTQAHRLDAVLACRNRRQDGDGRRMGARPYAAKHVHAVHTGHAQVQQNGVGRTAL